MRKGAVWMSEDREGGYLLGTFSGLHDTGGPRPRDRFEGLAIDEALAWARSRAERVSVELDGERYSAGAVALHDTPTWPPHDLPALVRRRPPGQEWRDRTHDDAPIAAMERALRRARPGEGRRVVQLRTQRLPAPLHRRGPDPRAGARGDPAPLRAARRPHARAGSRALGASEPVIAR